VGNIIIQGLNSNISQKPNILKMEDIEHFITNPPAKSSFSKKRSTEAVTRPNTRIVRKFRTSSESSAGDDYTSSKREQETIQKSEEDGLQKSMFAFFEELVSRLKEIEKLNTDFDGSISDKCREACSRIQLELRRVCSMEYETAHTDRLLGFGWTRQKIEDHMTRFLHNEMTLIVEYLQK